MKRVSFSFERVGLIAQNTLREATRQKLFHFLVFLALALVLSARWFREFNFGAPELKFLADFGFGAMAFFGSALTIAATAQLFFSEIENRTALTLLAKPVWRSEFILGKFFGVVVLVGLFCALLTALLMAVLWTRERELMREFADAYPADGHIAYLQVALAGTLQWLKLVILTALTLVIASFARSQLFTIVTGFFILVICHLQSIAQVAYARSESLLSRAGAQLLSWIFPNFQLFTLADSLDAADAWPWSHYGRILIYTFGYTTAACALAAVSFRHREI